MDADELSASDPNRIADLLDVKPTTQQAWSRDEIGSILRHQLASPIQDEAAGSLVASGAAPALRDLLLKSHGDVLRDPKPPLEALELIKRSSKQRRSDPTSAVPVEVSTAVYYAAIAAGLARHGTRITDLSDEQLRTGLSWLLSQPWLEDSIRGLLQEALASLPPVNSHGDVRDGPTDIA